MSPSQTQSWHPPATVPAEHVCVGVGREGCGVCLEEGGGIYMWGGVTHFLSSSHTELQDLPSQQSWPHQSWCSNHCHTQSESVDASSLHISNTTCLTLQTSCFFTVHSHSTTVTLPQSSYHSHPCYSHPTTVTLLQSSMLLL